MFIFLGAIVFGVFLVFAPFQKNIPEPTSTHTGLAAGAFSYLTGVVPLGFIDEDILGQAKVLQTEDASAFFWPSDLGDYFSQGSGNSQELIESPHFTTQLFYVVAFALFGNSLSSVIALWGIVFILGVGVGLLVPLSRPGVQALGLVFGFVTLSILMVPFLDTNSLSVINYRLLPLLAVFPVAALVLLLTSGKPFPFRALPSGIFLGVLVGFVVVGRPTAAWTLIAIVTASLIGIWKLRGRTLLRATVGIIILLVSPLASIQLFSSLPAALHGKSSTPNSVGAPWIAANLGLFEDPRLYEKYVCTLEPPQTALVGVSHLPCSPRSLSGVQALFVAANPQNSYSDQKGYNAALRFIEERNLDADLALPAGEVHGDLTQFNMNWNVLGEVSREITLEMIRQDTGLVIQNLFFVKPVRLIHVLVQQPFTVFRNTAQGPSLPLLLVPLTLISAVFFFTGRDILGATRKSRHFDELKEDGRRATWALFLLAVASMTPAIAFYAMSYTALDIGVLVSSFLTFLILQMMGQKPHRGLIQV